MTRPVKCQGLPWSVGPDDPAIQAHRVHDAQHTISLYRDGRWDLRPLGGPPGSSPRAIIFDGFPESLRETFRRAAWLIINTPTPAVMLERPGSCAVEYLNAGSIGLCVGGRWRWFATWLHEEGFERLCDVARSDLERFAKRVQRSTYARETKLALLAGVTRLWAHATQLPDGDVLPMPPWEDEALALFLPGGGVRRDNATPIVHPSTMSPLLFWAQEFLNFAVDIQAAQQRWQELVDSMPAARSGPQRQRAVALVAEWIAAGRTSLPESPKVIGSPDFDYLATVHGGIRPDDLHSALGTNRRLFVADRNEPSPIDSPIVATVDGKPWCSAVNRRELQILHHAVQGAALVVITYLTGMRPNEVLALKPGCCVRERSSATTVRYTVHGRKFKHVRANGSTKPDGVEASWVTIAPAARAAEAMARMFPDSDVLFPSPADSTVPMSTACASDRIATLISAANGICRNLDLPQTYSIPNDPAGAVTLKRFRRTLAWHIRRLPHGRVALAIQYGHLRFSHGSGYAGLATSGFAKLMDREEVTALRETVELTRRELADGGGVSGPAANRLIDLVGRGIDFEGAYLTDREVRRIKADTRLKLYDNPHSYVACLFDPERSLCRNPRTMAAITEPKLEQCQPNCPNIARTDRHIAQLAVEVERLRSEAESPMTPVPMAQRLKSEAERMTTTIDTHRAMAIRPVAVTNEVSA